MILMCHINLRIYQCKQCLLLLFNLSILEDETFYNRYCLCHSHKKTSDLSILVSYRYCLLLNGHFKLLDCFRFKKNIISVETTIVKFSLHGKYFSIRILYFSTGAAIFSLNTYNLLVPKTISVSKNVRPPHPFTTLQAVRGYCLL